MKVNEVYIKDALYYLHKNSGASDEKVNGILVGLFCGLMAHGMTFQECIEQLKKYIRTHAERKDFRKIESVLPVSWLPAIK